MAIAHFVATVKEERLLELPKEADALHLQPGEEVSIMLDRNSKEQTVKPNEKGLAAMREIAERQKNRPYAEGSDVVKLVRDARAGAM